MYKYQVGDIVEVVNNFSGHGFARGEVVEILGTVNLNESYPTYSAKGELEDVWMVVEQDISDLTFDTPSKEPDMVNSPAHYGNGRIECIEYIEDFLTTEEYIGYLRGNIAKYLHRFRYKNGLEDLKKAEWYLDRLSGVVEDQECLKS